MKRPKIGAFELRGMRHAPEISASYLVMSTINFILGEISRQELERRIQLSLVDRQGWRPLTTDGVWTAARVQNGILCGLPQTDPRDPSFLVGLVAND